MTNTAQLDCVSEDIKDRLEEASEANQSPMMDFHDPVVVRISDNKYLFGTLEDDPFPQNPLEDQDGMGHIYTSHIHDTTNSDMQEALGLDSYWDKDLSLVDDHPSVVRPLWVATAADDEEFHQWCQENGRPPKDSAKLSAYYKRKAAQFWRETGGLDPVGFSMDPDISDFEFTDSVLEVAYDRLNEAGKIGNPDRVILDVYQHSGTKWSIAGEGMQCQWDTANGAGVWVPDDSLLSELDRRAPVYAFGRIIGKEAGFMGNRDKPYFFVLDSEFGEVRSMRHAYWHEAFEAMQSFIKEQKLKLPRKKLEAEALLQKGRHRAAIEICRSSLETYNCYINGFCFGTSVETIEIQDDGSIEVVDQEAGCGFYGDDDAMGSLRETVENLKTFHLNNQL